MVVGISDKIADSYSISWQTALSDPKGMQDYEVVVFILGTLSQEIINQITEENINHFRQSVLEIIKNGKTELYCISADLTEGEINNYDIWPFALNVHNTDPMDGFSTTPTGDYFAKVRTWTHYFDKKISHRPEIGESIIWDFKPILSNNEESPIAFQAEVLYRPNWGKITFYPPQSDILTREISENFVTYYKNAGTAKIPDYIKKIRLPEQMILDNELIVVEEKIKILQEEREGILTKLGDLDAIKGVLVFEGNILTQMVTKMLMELKIQVAIDEIDSDKIIRMGDITLPLEIRGHIKAAGIDDLGQILMRSGRYHNTDATPVKGILIVNGHKDMPLEKRGDDFEKPIVNSAKELGICLISTRTLFNIWLDYIDSGTTTLSNDLLSAPGELKYKK